MSKLTDLSAAYEAVRKKFMTDAQASLKEAFKEVFDKFPSITAFVWTQYTPYFNDGEPCEFSVGEVYFTNLPADKLGELSSYGEYEGEEEVFQQYGTVPRTAEYYVCSNVRSTHYKTGEPTYPASFDGVDTEVLQDLLSALNSGTFKDVLLGCFGDHVRILATPNGFDVEDHDHD